MSSIVTEIQEQIQKVAQPLFDNLRTLDHEIARREVELVELKQARTQLAKVVKGIDPTMLPEPEKPKARNTRSNLPGAEKLLALTEWLQAHSEELNTSEGFYATGLDRDYNGSVPVKGNSSLSAALHVLHEQGVIRLISTGTGGSRYYEVVV